MGLANQVAIIGTGTIKFGENIVDQLLGRAGKMQGKGARTGLAHTLGGPGTVSCVAVRGEP